MSEHVLPARQAVRFAASGFLAIAALLPFEAAAQAQFEVKVAQSAPGRSSVAAAAVNLRALPDVGAADLAARPRFRIGPLTGSSPSVYAARKAAARGAPAATLAAPAVGDSPAPPTVTQALNLAGNAEAECGNAAPSDQALAVGDGQNPILQVNQDCLSVWSPAGARLLGPKTLQALAGLPANTYVFDPRALYDWYNHRFIIAFGDSDLANNSYYDIAASQSDDPTGNWYLYRFPTAAMSNVMNDFIRIGQDRQGVYLSSNLFQMSGSCCGDFLEEELLLLPKSRLYAGGPLSYWMFAGMGVCCCGLCWNTDSLQPDNVWSPYENPRAEFLVETFNINLGGGNCVSGCGNIVAYALSNQFGWLDGSLNPPEFTGLVPGVAGFSLPPQASQPGAPNSIDTLDVRITGEVTYSQGLLLWAITTGGYHAGVSDIMIYQHRPFLDDGDPACPANACPRLTRVDSVSNSLLSFSPNFAYYPTPQRDLAGNRVTVFNFSGPSCATCYPGVGFIGQRANSAVDFTDTGLLLKTGQALYNQPFWGRYTAAAPVGVGYAANGSVATPGVAFAGAYAKADGSWGTQIGYTAYTAPNQP